MAIWPVLWFLFGLSILSDIVRTQLRIVTLLGWAQGRFVVTVPFMLVAWGYWVKPPRTRHLIENRDIGRAWLEAMSAFKKGEGPPPIDPGDNFAATYLDPFKNPPVPAWLAVLVSAVGLVLLLRALRGNEKYSSNNGVH